MKNLSKTAATATARRHVSIQGSGTSWQITHPHDKLDGPSTSTSASSYQEAQTWARRIKASLALKLMGKSDNYADYAIYNDGYAPMTLEDLIEIGLKASRR